MVIYGGDGCYYGGIAPHDGVTRVSPLFHLAGQPTKIKINDEKAIGEKNSYRHQHCVLWVGFAYAHRSAIS